MHRASIRLLSTVALVALVGCGTARTSEPGVADVDFTPKAIVSVDEAEVTIGPRPDDDASSFPKGTVIEIHNTGSANHRVQGTRQAPGNGDETTGTREDIIYDTGIMFPGNSTTVVLSITGEITFRDFDTVDHAVTVDITATK